MVQKKNSTFVRRTRAILNNYGGKFDVTLLINCCVGLIFMATEKQEYKTTISQSSKCIDDYGIPSKCIQTTYGEDISLESVCRHIRNAIAHCHFTFNCKNSREIDAIVFHDQNPYNTSETSKPNST